MATIRFFKKLSPETVVVFANGTSAKFTTLDQLEGFFATDNEYIHGEFERLMKENRYGITEIPAEEFHRDYVQKKNLPQPSRPVSREQLGSGLRREGHSLVESLGADRVAAVVGVNRDERAGGTSMAPAPVTMAPGPAASSKPAEFTPPLGTRSKTKRPRSAT